MNIKQLLEKRNELVAQMDKLFNGADAETRAFNADEVAQYDSLTGQIKDIDSTVAKYNESRAFTAIEEQKEERKAEVKQYDIEARAFADYIRTGRTAYTEKRDAVNMTTGDNGAVIPTTIAHKIIETVENICPIFALSTHYNVKGTLSFPVYSESTSKVTCAYATEFTALESKTGKFTKVDLGGFLAGALTKISRSLINNTEFDLVGYIISKVALAISRFLEKEFLLGTGSSACQGVVTGCTQKVTAAAAAAISADDLIKLQIKVPKVYQADARWIMNEKTLLALRQLKDGDGRYMLQDDLTKGFGYMLLGKPVEISDQLDDIEKSKSPIVYGDFSGLYANLRENVEIQLLQEKYADEHAVGVVAWLEVDSRLVETQKVALLTMAAS